MKIKITRPDGTVIEAEGTKQQLKDLFQALGMSLASPAPVQWFQVTGPTVVPLNYPAVIPSNPAPGIYPALPYIGDPFPGQEPFVITSKASHKA